MALSTRLLILWLLSEGPLHGYRIRKILSAPGLAFWFRIEDASIYSMLRGLVRQGFATAQEGTPTAYRITRAGRSELSRCIERAWRGQTNAKEPLCAALAAADELEADEIRDFLEARKAVLGARRAQLVKLAPAAPSGLLARREKALLSAEIAWLDAELEREES
ncbi:MAG: helix-turn-helix transcriptional regulator [Pseudomonadota bacterium]